MTDSNATFVAYAASLMLMLGYALSVFVSLGRARRARRVPLAPARPLVRKEVAAAEIKPPGRVRASSR